MSQPAAAAPHELKRVLKPVHLWAIAVGLVISGDYFGWNYGLGKAGPFGMVLATLAVTVLYVCFIFSYTELSTAIPSSGGPFAYARRGLGPYLGFLAGTVTLVEFVLAAAAIARAIGGYLNFRLPGLPIDAVALGAFVVFVALNLLGVSLAAKLELVITAVATFELLLFMGLTAGHVDSARILSQPLLPHGWSGVLAAVPFAIWFYLAIEGVAMSAEETINPKRDIPRGYIAGIATLVVLSLGTLICTAGVLPVDQLIVDDSPLPKVLAAVLAADHPMTHLMVYLGLFGLVASFHGIILGYSRQAYAMAREGLLPAVMGKLHPRFRTPFAATILPSLVGMGAVLSGKTDEIIAVSCLGATCLYVLSMAALFALRKKEPNLERPFRAPFYPVFPLVALVLSVGTLGTFIVFNPLATAVFAGIIAVASLLYFFAVKPPATSPSV